MQLAQSLRTGAVLNVVLAAALCLCVQDLRAQSKDARPQVAQGLPPRTAPADYQSHGKAGAVTIAADFVGHSVPTAEATLSTEDYVVVEVGLFGPPETRAQISLDDFSLRINGKKSLGSQPFGVILASLKDPEWVPPDAPTKEKSKTSLGGSGQGDSSGPPPEPKVPLELQRAMAQRTQKAALALGDRVLPQAGLLFFQFRGKTQNLKSVELIYAGSAGKVTLALHP